MKYRSLQEEMIAQKETMERMKKIEKDLALQSPSMQKLITRPLSEDAKAQTRPISPLGQTTLDLVFSPDTLDKMIPRRPLTPNEVQIEEFRRRASKNTQNQSTLSATTFEKKEAAISSFYHHPPADISKEDMTRLTGYTPIESKAPVEVWKPLTWYQAIFHFFKGNKVKQDDIGKPHWTD